MRCKSISMESLRKVAQASARTRNNFKPPAIASLDRTSQGLILASPNGLARVLVALLYHEMGVREAPDVPVWALANLGGR
jgi:hypothetical protein